MITRLIVEDGGSEWHLSVETDNGGDQSYGPFKSNEEAMTSLRSIVENDFDEPFLGVVENRRRVDEGEDMSDEIDVNEPFTPLPPMIDGRLPCPRCGEKSDRGKDDATWECPLCLFSWRVEHNAKFGHHPDPAIDAEIECGRIHALLAEAHAGLLRALDYRAATPEALSIKHDVRDTLRRTGFTGDLGCRDQF